LNATEIIAFRDLSGLIKWFKVALGALFIATLLTVYTNWQQIDLSHRLQNDVEDVDDATIDEVSGVALGVTALKVVTSLMASVLLLRWTYLTKKNTLALDASDLAFSPGWSVGCYLVPVVGLWMPYQSLRETFKASHPDFRANWKSAPHPRLLPWWWGVWIVCNVLGLVLYGLTFNDVALPNVIEVAWVDMLSAPVQLTFLAALWALVSTLQQWQTAKFLALQAGHAAAAQPG